MAAHIDYVVDSCRRHGDGRQRLWQWPQQPAAQPGGCQCQPRGADFQPAFEMARVMQLVSQQVSSLQAEAQRNAQDMQRMHVQQNHMGDLPNVVRAAVEAASPPRRPVPLIDLRGLGQPWFSAAPKRII